MQRLTYVAKDNRTQATFVIFLHPGSLSDFRAFYSDMQMDNAPPDAQLHRMVKAVCESAPYTACVLECGGDFAKTGLQWYRAPHLF